MTTRRPALQISSRMTLREALWIILGLMALGLFVKYAIGWRITPTQTLVIAAIPIILLPPTILLELRARRRRRRDIEEMRCEKCRYPLRDVPTEICPECGHDNSWRKMA